MKISTRKRLGAALLITSLLVVIAVYISGTPLLPLQESHTTSSGGGAVMTVAKYKPHWSLRVFCVPAIVGLVIFFSGTEATKVAAMTTPPNHALQRTRRVRRGCNHCVPCAGSLSLGR
jgi:hypothetical protein